MTREEAIEIIKECREKGFRYTFYTVNEYHTALDMAIKALEQDPCEDWCDVPSDEMTLEQARQAVKDLRKKLAEYLMKETCEDCISRQAAIDAVSIDNLHPGIVGALQSILAELPPVTPQPKIGHCKDCKWWKDSDGVYRRGVGSESQCPINRREVLEGNGYCYMFESKMQEVEEKN